MVSVDIQIDHHHWTVSGVNLPDYRNSLVAIEFKNPSTQESWVRHISQEKMNIKAKLGEEIHELNDIDIHATINDLKIKLESKTSIPASAQKWIFQGRILSDSLLVKDSNMTDDSCVIVLKTSIPSSQNTTGQSSQPILTNLQVNTAEFDKGMYELLTNSDTIVEDAITLLFKICNNIINNPNEEKYRKLSSTNATFMKKIGTIRGGNACMSGIGFQLHNTDWILVPSVTAWDVLVKCKLKLETFLNKLNAYKQNNNVTPTTSSATTTTTTTSPIVTATTTITITNATSSVKENTNISSSSSSSSSIKDLIDFSEITVTNSVTDNATKGVSINEDIDNLKINPNSLTSTSTETLTGGLSNSAQTDAANLLAMQQLLQMLQQTTVNTTSNNTDNTTLNDGDDMDERKPSADNNS